MFSFSTITVPRGLVASLHCRLRLRLCDLKPAPGPGSWERPRPVCQARSRAIFLCPVVLRPGSLNSAGPAAWAPPSLAPGGRLQQTAVWGEDRGVSAPSPLSTVSGPVGVTLWGRWVLSGSGCYVLPLPSSLPLRTAMVSCWCQTPRARNPLVASSLPTPPNRLVTKPSEFLLRPCMVKE